MKPSGSLACLIGVLGLIAAGRGAEDEMAVAHRLWLTGKYAEAGEIYVQAGSRPEAVLGLARCLAAQGKRSAAEQKLIAAAGKHARLHAELASLALERGDHEAARRRANRALELDPDSLPAHWVQAELLRLGGRLDEAEQAYRWFVTYHNEHDVEDPEALDFVGRAAGQYARWNRLHDQFHFLVNELYPDVLKHDPNYWPAHVAAGRLYLEKYNQPEAARQFQAALAINPNAAEVHAALAACALEDHQLDDAEAAAGRALQLDPGQREAWLCRADLLWANFQAREALDLLERKIRPLNPLCQETLGRIAACYAILDGIPKGENPSRMSKLVEEVTARDPQAGDFFFSLGAWLEDRNRFADAERWFREVLRRMPRRPGPQSHLGLMAMHAGREEEAGRWIRAAFDADPYNVRLANMTQLLEVLEEMQTYQTPQVRLRYVSGPDAVLARCAAERLEQIYPRLCATFGYCPAEKPLVEFFRRTAGQGGHSWFSTRMTGLPYLGTVAASTGRIVALVSPGDAELASPFNWARVLTHELVHVITLQQTRFNIPHWYTEGLAVWSENRPRPHEWNTLLVERVRRGKGKLFNLQTLNGGFARPGSGDDWQMAYCQAQLYVDYMLARGGQPCLRKLLDAYAEDLATPEAIGRVFGVTQAEFERGYREHVRRVAAGVKLFDEPQRGDLVELLAAQRARPDDADAGARLAYGYLRRGAAQEARSAAQRALQLQPRHALAAYVVARLHAEAGQSDEAIRLLEQSLDRKAPEGLALNLLAGLKAKAQRYAEAAELYALGEQCEPTNLKWARALARVQLLAGDQAQLDVTLERIARADPDDLTSRTKLAATALARHDWAAASDWARQALDIHATDPALHGAFAEAEAGRHNYPQAIEAYELAVRLDPGKPGPRLALAQAYLAAQQPQPARRVLEELLKLAPQDRGARALLEEIPATGTPEK